MIKVYEYAGDSQPAVLSVSLPLDERKKSRLKAVTDSGESLGFILPRGRILRDGTLLVDETGRVIQVKAAPETVSTVSCDDTHQLLQAAYHLGNRHVPLQIGQGWLRYQHDHVLDAMVEGLGLRVQVEQQPFEPEEGAYSQGNHKGHHHHHD